MIEFKWDNHLKTSLESNPDKNVENVIYLFYHQATIFFVTLQQENQFGCVL